jgi:lycopene cyclase domain-containing protein
MTLYGWLMLFSFIGPFALSFDKKVAFYKQWSALFIGIGINAVLFLLWDSWFAMNKIWGFNPNYSSTFRLFELPIEEYLFFIVVPYASVFIYACLKVYLANPWSQKTAQILNWFALLVLIAAIVCYNDRLYTVVNASVALILLIFHMFIAKKNYLPYFWMAYWVHLIPFAIINGILTGATTPEPVVWYNAEQIIGWRFVTIPAEDFIYAFTCLLLPITVMEAQLSKK